MSKLKTLKDLRKETLKDLRRGLLELKALEDKTLSKLDLKAIKDMDTDKRFFREKELRQTAIKHMKVKDCPLKDLGKCNGFCGECGVNSWIRYFFNITDEELK